MSTRCGSTTSSVGCSLPRASFASGAGWSCRCLWRWRLLAPPDGTVSRRPWSTATTFWSRRWFARRGPVGGAKSFGLPADFEWRASLRDLLGQSSPRAAKRALDEIRWNTAERLACGFHFTIDVVLGYVVKLQILASWQRLDPEAGHRTLSAILGGEEGE
ncbi:DUF2764 family protein [Planctomycetota bacterium]